MRDSIAISLFCIISAGECLHHHTDNYGKRRVQNSLFNYVFPQVPDGTNRFTVSVKGSRDVYIALSPSEGELPDDEAGEVGSPKIGKLVNIQQ